MATESQHDAYRNHLCIDCQNSKHSAGRTRCNPCHDRNNPATDPLADRDNYLCQLCGKAQTRPGAVLCGLCRNLLKGRA